MNKKISNSQRYIIFITTLFLIAFSIVFDISIFYGFFASIIVTFIILNGNGYNSKDLLKIIAGGLRECSSLYIFILLIGGTISVWLSSGVVPAMIYYGLQYMRGFNFLLASFIISSIAALFMGTAVGTLSTIGIALMGIGRGFGLPPHILLGAIVSGSFLADKLSPISGLLNLTLVSTKTNYRSTAISMLKTLIPVYLITAIIYYYIGWRYAATAATSSLQVYQTALGDGFDLTPWLLALPIIMVILSVVGLKPLYTIGLGLVGGVLISGGMQKLPVKLIINSIVWGYRGTTSSPELNKILFSGGVAAMVEVVFIVAGAIALSSLFEGSGLIKPVIEKIVSSIRTEGQLIRKTGLVSSILTIITCDQTVGIVMPGRVFRAKFNQLGVGNHVMARTISDTGTIIAPLFPWNVNALIIGIITGVSALSYGPYAVLCYIFPLFTFVYSFFVKLGHGLKRSPNKKQPSL